MKQLSVHITFFYKEDRLKYLYKVIGNLKEIDDVDIFIHTNKAFAMHGCTTIVHDISKIHPYFLSWCSRNFIKQQANQYKYYMYVEDDIIFNKKNFDYYLKYHDICKENNSYLGFLRIEQNHDKKWFLTDLIENLHDTVELNGTKFYKCNNFRYAAMWILDNDELNKFINEYSDLYNFKKYHYQPQSELDMVRENAAIGPIYEMFENELVIPNDDCYIHHAPNNYADDPTVLIRISVDDIIK